jgi:hypothetical protein
MASFVSVLKLSLVNGSVLLLTDYVIKETFAANLRNFPHVLRMLLTHYKILLRDMKLKADRLTERVAVAAKLYHCTLKFLGSNFCRDAGCFA